MIAYEGGFLTKEGQSWNDGRHCIIGKWQMKNTYDYYLKKIRPSSFDDIKVSWQS